MQLSHQIRLFPTMTETQPQRSADESQTASTVQLKAIRKVYYKPDGSVLVAALQGIDLEIRRGAYLAIMGQSGSGKSTLMNILGCLDRPTDGEYLLDGANVADLDDEQISVIRGQKIGFVFQAFNLISALTIQENVEVPLFYQGIKPAIRTQRAMESLELVGLGDRRTHRPSELSGGQQQRAAIARAIVSSPSIIMADEPTGNLDTATGKAILAIFDSLHDKGMTIIMVTHETEVAGHCNRIITLRDGFIETDEMFDR